MTFLTTLFWSMTTVSVGNPIDPPTWMHRYLTVDATSRVSAQSNTGPANHRSIDGNIFVFSPAQIQLVRDGEKIAGYMSYLLFQNKPSEALRYYDQITREYEDMFAPITAELRADAAILLQKSPEAEAILLKQLQSSRQHSEAFYVRLSLSIALNGRVHDGQIEFCRTAAKNGLKNRPREQQAVLIDLLDSPVGVSRDVAAVESCLALMTQGGPAFGELALQLSPGCRFAAARLMDYYCSKGKIVRARDVANKILKKIDEPSKRAFFVGKLKLIEHAEDYVVDKPMSPPSLKHDPPQ